MHYENGIPADKDMPDTSEFLNGNEEYGYPPINVINEPGTRFKYSGAGFLLLQHLIEKLEGKYISDIIAPFLNELGIEDGITFENHPKGRDVAYGYDDDKKVIEGTRKMFPGFAAGALGTSYGMMKFLEALAKAYNCLEGCGPISHDTASLMLRATDKGCFDFMGVKMGLGIFVGEAGDNRLAIHQGANDGFRAIYCYCFAGPDQGTGFTVFANGDNKAMFFIAEASCKILKLLKIQGVDTTKFRSQVSLEGITQEEIVNIGYKELVFSAFAPTLPPVIVDKGPKDPLAQYNRAVGAEILKVTNQRFARADNLFSDHQPKFDPELFCPMGKVMDSWESARHNEQECDVLIARLKAPAAVNYVAISTKYHFGNQVEFVEIFFQKEDQEWICAVPKKKLEGHAEIRIALPGSLEVDNIKIHAFPDGGLTRVALYGIDLPGDVKNSFLSFENAECIVSKDEIPHTKKPLQLLYRPTSDEVAGNIGKLENGQEFDAISLAYGGNLVSVTNEHYGPAAQVLSPYVPLSMHDGFESARSRVKGHKEILVVGLGSPHVVHRVELDFTFFVNNNPRSVQVYGRTAKDDSDWVELVKETNVKAYAGNWKAFNIAYPEELCELKLVAIPDGGVNRVKAFSYYNAHGTKRKHDEL
mmetsp:Transcript_11411/g.14867  ORF Transcript_11411/g.14867 Transcript_11411/m.14867 type:complete len:644 (-) Transcript_11411:367-2298(-)